jgi:hypothetical protein
MRVSSNDNAVPPFGEHAARYARQLARSNFPSAAVAAQVHQHMLEAIRPPKISPIMPSLLEMVHRQSAMANVFQSMAERQRKLVELKFAPMTRALPDMTRWTTPYSLVLPSMRFQLATLGLRQSTTASVLQSLANLPRPMWAQQIYFPALASTLAQVQQYANAIPEVVPAQEPSDVETAGADLEECGFIRQFHRVCQAVETSPGMGGALCLNLVVALVLTALSWAQLVDPTVISSVEDLWNVLGKALVLAGFVMDQAPRR